MKKIKDFINEKFSVLAGGFFILAFVSSIFISLVVLSDDEYRVTVVSDGQVYTFECHDVDKTNLEDGRFTYKLIFLDGSFTYFTVGDHTYSCEKIRG